MDWLKLFALLVAVAIVQTAADAPKKKIRIHLPQKVKHIHHHKKIYITNHPASPQYAPAFMPSAEGAVAVPTNVAMPAVASMLPVNSVELYDEQPTRMPGISAAASKLLPLYRARGYYGPTPHGWDEQEYDMAPPPEPTDGYIPTAFSAPAAATLPPSYPPKRVKLLKVNEPPRKKIPRKVKSKRVIFRGKPQLEEEHPVSTFHEQFYSDVDGSGTIRKIRKPPRVEKIIDGDTEHIHTYSEEHIHKLIYDDGSKIPGMVGLDSISSMSALSAQHPHLKNPQSLLAIPSDTLTGFTAVGSMGTPSHLEYSAYNPRDATHDHIFHDHGEIPADADITKDQLFPTRINYNNQGTRFGLAGTKKLKTKYGQKFLKPRPKPAELYFDNIYNPYNNRLRPQKPTIPASFEPAQQSSLEDYRPLPSFKLKDKTNVKSRNVVPALYFGNGKQVSDYRLQQPQNVQSPYSVSSTVVHEYKPKPYSDNLDGTVGINKYNKNLYNYPNNFEFDTYPSSSSYFGSENPAISFQAKKGKKKSISTQNISFGGLDHQTTVDHLEDSGVSGTSLNGIIPSALDTYHNYEQPKALEPAPSTAFTIRESSPVHPYYSAMAVKALHGEQFSLAEASNDNFQYAEAPSLSSTSFPVSVTQSTPTPEYFELHSSEAVTTEPASHETRQRSILKENIPDTISVHKETRPRYKIIALQTQDSSQETEPKYFKKSADSSSGTGKLKYGDKI